MAIAAALATLPVHAQSRSCYQVGNTVTCYGGGTPTVQCYRIGNTITWAPPSTGFLAEFEVGRVLGGPMRGTSSSAVLLGAAWKGLAIAAGSVR